MRGRVTALVLLLLYATTCQCQGNDLKVENGQLTFDAEGNDNPRSRFFSRKLHVPSAWSGITMGRGYDIKYKREGMVLRDLQDIGVAKNTANKIAKGIGKRGRVAKAFILEEALQTFVLSRSQQKSLFIKTYRRQERETKRLVKKYYKMEWKSLQKKIGEVLVDLKFRGDFTPYRSYGTMGKLKKAVLKNSLPDFTPYRSYGTMGELKKAVLKNSLPDFTEVISKRSFWRNVPYDRFRRRKLFLVA